jgi:putative RNA 2'-phosphotransferase
MSGLLRHTPEKANLTLDVQGYVEVKSLCNALKIDREELDWIVDNNNKKRFAYNNDSKSKIRASQGHSIEIDHGYVPIEPPDILYHGTSWKNSESIYENGILKGTRQHVHLTDTYETAENVGKRHTDIFSDLWVIIISGKNMFDDGYTFYKSENGVYLTDHIPSIYFMSHDPRILDVKI